MSSSTWCVQTSFIASDTDSYCLLFQTCIWDVAAREMRAECFIQMGEAGKAISDLKAASKLKNDNTQAFYKLSTIYYNLGDHEMSLK